MIPVGAVVLSELARSRGSLLDRELYENVKKVMEAFGVELSRSEFNKILMTLELRGYIRVEGVKRDARIVHLVRIPHHRPHTRQHG